MKDACLQCPCPETCVRWPGFCRWAAEIPADPVKLAHIRSRSKMGDRPRREPITPSPETIQALALTRLMNDCEFRSVGPGCGCSGAKCALRGAAVVSHLDCFACLKAYP